jgi:hypothetical protein
MYIPKYLFKFSHYSEIGYLFIGEDKSQGDKPLIVWMSDAQLKWQAVKVKAINSDRHSRSARKTVTLDNKNKIDILNMGHFKKAAFTPFGSKPLRLIHLEHTIETYNSIKLPYITGLDTSLIPQGDKPDVSQCTKPDLLNPPNTNLLFQITNNNNDRVNCNFEQFIQAVKIKEQELISCFSHAMIFLAKSKEFSTKYNLTVNNLFLTLHIPNTPVEKIAKNLQNCFEYGFCSSACDVPDIIVFETKLIKKHWNTINQTMRTIANDTGFVKTYSASTIGEITGNKGKSASVCKLK